MMNVLKRIFVPNIFTGWHMLGVLGLFFGTIISVNMVLAFSAVSTWTGLVVPNTYVESQNFNARRAELHEQSKLGWTATSKYELGMIKVDVRDGSDQTLDGLAVFANLGRPVHEADDRVLELHFLDGRYQAATALGAGEWKLTVQARDAENNNWIHSIRFVVEG